MAASSPQTVPGSVGQSQAHGPHGSAGGNPAHPDWLGKYTQYGSVTPSSTHTYRQLFAHTGGAGGDGMTHPTVNTRHSLTPAPHGGSAAMSHGQLPQASSSPTQ